MSLKKNIEIISSYFSKCENSEQVYHKIIFLGSQLPRFPEKDKIEKNLVSGCQSKTYLTVQLEDNKILLQADSDALITKGICAILIKVYHNVEPLEILKHEPQFIKDLKFEQNLSPNRSNGFFQILNKLKKSTLKFYLESKK